MASQWTGNIFPWPHALPFWSHPPWLHPSLACYPLIMLAYHLILEPAKILSVWEPLQLLSPSAGKTFLISSHSWLHLIIQISALLYLLKHSLTSLFCVCMLPTHHTLAYQPIPFKTYFLAFITIWNQPVNQWINLYVLCFYLSVSLPSTPIEWEKNPRYLEYISKQKNGSCSYGPYSCSYLLTRPFRSIRRTCKLWRTCPSSWITLFFICKIIVIWLETSTLLKHANKFLWNTHF